uniref:CBS domain-containing protein n=1 Tax=Helicotheca tamesis TaxID=374047 RepID=A0A7S2DZL6_9STRA|mmetsp:Transcript_11192/g.15514  ORF Transcript_11192/g.15514 Transcript_11192/m.15514 type:complete len:152 (+) Transcript_11192:261-716(+)
MEKSCYVEIEYTIPEDEMVYEAVRRFCAYKIGALVTTDKDGNLSGIVTERDFVTKFSPDELKDAKKTKITDIYTPGEKLITATPHDEIGVCMNKILSKDVRHLPLLGDDGKSVVGMISVKDLVKVALDEKQKMIDTLSNFALGKGGHYIED